MWCFSNDQLEAVLDAVRERYLAAGHPPNTVDFALRATRAVLRSQEAAKLRVREHPVEPLPLFEVEEIEPEEVTCAATGI